MTYFQTDNPALAIALSMCDAKVPQTPAGPFPMLMMYTLANLKALGYSGDGAKQAGQKARRDKKAGTRVWQFLPDDVSNEVLEGWKEAEAIHAEGKPMTLDAPNARDIGKWAFFFNEWRKMFLTSHDMPTYIAFHGETKTDKQHVEIRGKKTDAIAVATTRGTFSCVSIDAPDEVWREIRA